MKNNNTPEGRQQRIDDLNRILRREPKKTIEGEKYGKLEAVSYHSTKNKRPYWLFKCKCGNEKIADKAQVICGNVRSCGCLISTAYNPRKSIFISYNGETKSLKEWCEQLGLVYSTICWKRRIGKWKIEDEFNK